MCLLGGGGEISEVTALVSRLWPRNGSRIHIGVDLDGARHEVELNLISVLHGGNGTTDSGFRRAMNTHDAVGDA